MPATTDVLLSAIATLVVGLIGWQWREMTKLRRELDRLRLEKSASIAQRISSEKISLRKMLELIQRQGSRCALTGIGLRPENAKLDRIRSSVGDFKNGSVQVVSREVAAMKSAVNGDQRRFVELCCAVCRHKGKEEPN